MLPDLLLCLFGDTHLCLLKYLCVWRQKVYPQLKSQYNMIQQPIFQQFKNVYFYTKTLIFCRL